MMKDALNNALKKCYNSWNIQRMIIVIEIVIMHLVCSSNNTVIHIVMINSAVRIHVPVPNMKY